MSQYMRNHYMPIVSCPVPKIDYPVGSNVEFEYDHNWQDGVLTTFGKILSYRTFYNDVWYTIQNLLNKTIKEYGASSVKRIVTIPPKYDFNQRVSVILKVYAQHQIIDDIHENATQININYGFAETTYDVILDSGARKVVREYSIGKVILHPKTAGQTENKQINKTNKQLMRQNTTNKN